MHTAEIEHTPLAQRFRFLRSEDTAIATLAAWTVGVTLFTLAGFYIGTIAGHDNHPVADPSNSLSMHVANGVPAGVWRAAGRQVHEDLTSPQLAAAIPFAVGGLILGLAFALWITFRYVPAKLAELDLEQGHH